MEIIDIFSSLSELCLQHTPQSRLKKHFFLEEKFILERNGLSDISMTNNFSNLNGLRL